MSIQQLREAKRTRRRHAIRKKVSGTSARPRLTVFKSNRYLYAQLIDDSQGKTLAAADSRSFQGKGVAHATKTGALLAEQALAKKITQAVFDRAGYRYHGVVKALSEAANEHGLKH